MGPDKIRGTFQPEISTIFFFFYSDAKTGFYINYSYFPKSFPFTNKKVFYFFLFSLIFLLFEVPKKENIFFPQKESLK